MFERLRFISASSRGSSGVRIGMRGAVLLSVCLYGLSGCLLRPGSGLTIPDIDTPVEFSGRSGVPDSAVQILAAPEPGGPFGSVVALATGPAALFSGDAVIPAELWNRVCPGGGFETFVRADLPGGGSLITFDDASVTGRTPEECLAEETAESGIVAAVNACAAASTPLSRVVTESNGAATEIDGDVLINDPADVEALVCVERIFGSLEINDMVEDLVSLPALVEVTGDVTIVYERGSVTMVTAETVDLPALRVVGGDLHLSVPRPPVGGEIVSVDFGLPALIGVFGDLRIEIDAFNSSARGMAMLPSVAGNVVYDGASSDATGSGLLTALTSIGGDLDVTLGGTGGTTQGFFNSLTSVVGDVSVTGGLWVGGRNFNSLGVVGGGLRLSNFDVFPNPPASGPTSFDALINVGGVLDVDALRQRVEDVGAAAVALGGIRLNANTWLTDLAVSLLKYTLIPTAPITITNNPNLPECDAIAYVAGLTTGPVTISGNQPCGPI